MKNFLTTVFLFSVFTLAIFPQSEIPDPDMWATDGPVVAIAVEGDYTYIGGYFNNVGPNTGHGVKLTTTSDSPDLTFPKVNNHIIVAVPDGSGGWFIGGAFTKVGTYDRNRIARINSDGTVDAAWNPNANNGVETITISGSDIYVGGSFTAIGGQTRNRIAKLNITTGAVDLTWNPNASSFVNTIAISGSDIYVGGNFTSIGGQSRNRIAKLNNTTGAADLTWDPNASSFVYEIAISGSDIYVGGLFTSIGGQSRNRIAKLNNTTGAADLTWNPIASHQVNAIAISGSDIYAGGRFSSIGGVTRNGIAKLNNTTGAVDLIWDAAIPTSNGTVDIIAISGSDIYVGGDFTSIGGVTRNHIARLNNTTGAADLNWNPNANGPVYSIAISGSDIYAGGYFTSIGRETRNYIARLNNTTGAVDLTWNPNASSLVFDINISGNDIYVGGNFTSIGGQTRNRIAKLNNTTGAADLNWDPNASHQVKEIAISGNDIYVGGEFTSIGGQTRNRIAKLNNTTGAADLNWNPNASSIVYAIAISGSDIYVGGEFTSIGGETRNRIAKLNDTTGLADLTWNPNANLAVYEITTNGIASDIYVGGNFSSIGGETRNYIAKLNNTDGAADLTWNPNADDFILAIAIEYLSGGAIEIYVGGYFTSIGGVTRNNIAKLNNTTGAVDLNWNPNVDGHNEAIDVIDIDYRDIYVGGGFTSIGGSWQGCLALFRGESVSNTPPQFVSPTPVCGSTINVNLGSPVSFTITAEDGDAGDVVSLSVIGLPSGSSMDPVLPASGNPVSSLFNWTPDLASVGNHAVTFEITDNNSDPVSCSFNIEVVNDNVAPIFVSTTPECGSTLSVYAGSPINFSVQAEDTDVGNSVTLSVSGLPSGSVMNPLLPADGNPVSSEFSWTPVSSDVGTYEIIYTAMDNFTASAVCTLVVYVEDIPAVVCPLNQLYWEANPSTWPVSELILGTVNNYTATELLSLLGSSIRSDASITLAKQLIAAKLNVANGAPVPTAVADAIANADNTIGTLVIPANIRLFSRTGITMLLQAIFLWAYNNNFLTPDCVSTLSKQMASEEEIAMPVNEYTLFDNYPNPFNPTTKIMYTVPNNEFVTLKVFNTIGEEVMTLVNEVKQPGLYEVEFNSNGLPSGVYLYRIIAADFVQTKKMILMK